ncbi:hypothetical protein [Xanthobacter agilis]|uniref:hypothetical protein n=1 Tax=Xanthobacter agilis TaxID=47492 RepID=UPI003726C3EE
MTQFAQRHTTRRTGNRIASLLLAASLSSLSLVALGLPLAVSLPRAAWSAPIDDYIAARDRLAAEVAAAVKAGEKEDAVDKRNASAIKDLQARMAALVGPVRFQGTQPAPIFMPTTLISEYLESKEPDGLLFSSSDYLTRFFISPEPVFLNWLSGRAAAADAPPVFRAGLAAAAGSAPLYNAVLGTDAAFIKYMDLPVREGAGPTVNAAFGLFTQTGARNDVPNSIVVTRVADGRVVIGAADVKVEIPPLPACDQIWSGYEAKAKALIAAAEKAKNDQDSRWDESAKVEEEGAAAYRACFVKAAPALPFYAAAAKQAEALLAAARGE